METADSSRSVIKIAVGSSSTITLILANYYGKMSLSSKSQEHLRMYWLYEQIEEKIEKNGESKELLLYLAEQFLIENTLWYSIKRKMKQISASDNNFACLIPNLKIINRH